MGSGDGCRPSISQRLIALADANSFYASCEQVFAPSLQHQPVIVLSNNDGIVIARSKEAKAIGIKMGVPVFQIAATIAQHQIQVFSSNYTLYGDLSARVMLTLTDLTPTCEIYSIDEAFLEVPRSSLNPIDYGQQVRKTVLQYTGIPLSIGIAPTKTLSKIANELAKANPDYQGVVDFTALNPALILADYPIEEVWGVGRRYAQRLRVDGITTAQHLCTASAAWIQQKFGVVLQRTQLELQGIPCIPLDICPPPKQSITTSRSFGRPITSWQEIREAIATYATRAAEKLREEALTACALQVFMHTNRFNLGTPQYSNAVVVSLPVATNDTAELIHYALRGGKQIYCEGYAYSKAGIILLELLPETQQQLNWLDQRHRDKYRQLMKVIDEINATFGRGTIQFAVAGLQKPWQMKRAQRSPCYTTQWSDLPIVKA